MAKQPIMNRSANIYQILTAHEWLNSERFYNPVKLARSLHISDFGNCNKTCFKFQPSPLVKILDVSHARQLTVGGFGV